MFAGFAIDAVDRQVETVHSHYETIVSQQGIELFTLNSLDIVVVIITIIQAFNKEPFISTNITLPGYHVCMDVEQSLRFHSAPTEAMIAFDVALDGRVLLQTLKRRTLVLL